jgi:cell division protein FtsL
MTTLIGPLRGAWSWQTLGIVLLFITTVFSAMGLVYTKYKIRWFYTQIQEVQQAREHLHIEWTQLLLEQGTLNSDARVERIARETLKMHIPSMNQIVIVRP